MCQRRNLNLHCFTKKTSIFQDQTARVSNSYLGMSAKRRPSESNVPLPELNHMDVGKTLCNRLLYSSDNLGAQIRDPFNVYKSTAQSVREKMFDNMNSTTEF